MEFMATALDVKPWIKRIVFELFNIVCTSPELISQIMTDKELSGYLEICLVSIQKFLETNKFELEDQESSGGKAVPRYLESRMFELEKPDIKINQIMVISIEAVTGFVEVISNLLFPNGLNTSDALSNSHSSVEPEEPPFQVPFSVSKLILRILV